MVRKTQEPSTAYDVALAIALNSFRRRVTALNNDKIQSPFCSGELRDADACWCMDLVRHEIDRLIENRPTYPEFDVWWCRVSSVVKCAYARLSDKHCAYARIVKGLDESMTVYAEMIEVAYRDGDQFFVCEASK